MLPFKSLLLTLLVRKEQPSYWACTGPLRVSTTSSSVDTSSPDSGPPGRHSLESMHHIFNHLYGQDPITLEGEHAAVALCDGLLFGLWNGHSTPASELPRRRAEAAAVDPGQGTECLGFADDDAGLEDDMRLSYMFGYGQVDWQSDEWTEVRRCEDGTKISNSPHMIREDKASTNGKV